MNRVLASALLLVAVPQVLIAQTADLRLRGKVGDHYSYKLDTSISAVGAQGVLSWKSTFREKLTKFSKGEFHWHTTFQVSDVKATGVMADGAASINQLNGLSVTLVQNVRGEVLRAIVGSTEVPSKGSSVVTYPGRKTKVGETWSAKIEVGNQIVPITYKLSSIKKQGKQTVAVIDGSFPKGSPAKAIKPTRFVVDTSNGKMLKGEGTTQMTVQGKTLVVAYTIART